LDFLTQKSSTNRCFDGLPQEILNISKKSKKILKNFKKGLDKTKRLCYNNKARCESGEATVLEN
jgi:hypothetical protein